MGLSLLLDRGVRNTFEEVELIAGELKKMGGGRVILVTSKPHNRNGLLQAGENDHRITRVGKILRLL